MAYFVVNSQYTLPKFRPSAMHGWYKTKVRRLKEKSTFIYYFWKSSVLPNQIVLGYLKSFDRSAFVLAIFYSIDQTVVISQLRS